jgi:transposase
MGAPYSLDLRIRVVTGVTDGMSCAEAAEHYQGVSGRHSSAIRWRSARRDGQPAALPIGGKKPLVLAGEEVWIRERVAKQPDITDRELLAELNVRDADESYYGVWHFLDHAGLSFQQACAPASRTVLMSRGDGNGRSGRASLSCPVRSARATPRNPLALFLQRIPSVAALG